MSRFEPMDAEEMDRIKGTLDEHNLEGSFPAGVARRMYHELHDRMKLTGELDGKPSVTCTICRDQNVQASICWSCLNKAIDRTAGPNVMRPGHPRWEEFRERLEGLEGCNFHKDDDDGKVHWSCKGRKDKSFAEAILTSMNREPDYPMQLIDIDASTAYFELNGGYCDCEILFNVAPRRGEEV